MSESGSDLKELLHQLDDPDYLERPRDYNGKELATPFENLSLTLNAAFATRCVVERDIQDSSQYGRIEVPAEATVCGTRIVVSVSKFGRLALVSADNPGAFLGTADAQAEGELDGNDLAKVEQVLVEFRYVVVSEEILTSRYDGPSRLIWHGSQSRPSWWHRFFGTF